jgi:hypothetical protein
VTNTLSSAQLGSGDGAVTRFAVSDEGKLTFFGRSDTVRGFTPDEAPPGVSSIAAY